MRKSASSVRQKDDDCDCRVEICSNCGRRCSIEEGDSVDPVVCAYCTAGVSTGVPCIVVGGRVYTAREDPNWQNEGIPNSSQECG